MQTTTEPAGNHAGLDTGGDLATGLMTIVADMMSLIVHVQATAGLIETAIQRDIAAADGNEGSGVVILDDVTPCYCAASEALSACNVCLDAALQSLLGTLSEARGSAQREVMSPDKSA